jgi:hypothetical protein
LQRIAYKSQAPEAKVAMNQSEAADLMAQSAMNSIEDILHDLPEQVDQARKLPRDVEDTSKVTSQVATAAKHFWCICLLGRAIAGLSYEWFVTICYNFKLLMYIQEPLVISRRGCI